MNVTNRTEGLMKGSNDEERRRAVAPDYEAASMEPFQPYSDERMMPHDEVPIEVLENVDRLERWVKKAVNVARRAQR